LGLVLGARVGFLGGRAALSWLIGREYTRDERRDELVGGVA
jgi:hypothetical protein